MQRRRRTYRRRPYGARIRMGPEGQPYQYGRYKRPIFTAEGTAKYGGTWKTAAPEQKLARLQNNVRGYGDYSSAWQKGRSYVPRAIGAAVGAAATRSISGAAAGWGHGASFSKNVLGWGDYGAVQGNQIMTGSAETPLSVNQAAGDLSGDVYFNHREYVEDVVVPAAGAFPANLRKFRINPGCGGPYNPIDPGVVTDDGTVTGVPNPDKLRGLFTWFRQLALNFTLFEFQGLVIEYRPMSGEDGGASTALGSIILATDYDPTNTSGFSSLAEMFNYDYSNSGKPSVEILHGIETKPSQQTVKMNYISGIDPTAKDRIFTDLGLFQYAVEGVPGTPGDKIGELWVSYRCKVSRAKIRTI